MNHNLLDKPADYFSYGRLEMLKFVPPKAKTILDVGCGRGKFGEQIKKQRPVEIWGIEFDTQAASKAKSVLDKVLEGDVNDLITKLPDKYFDCVVFNDVLEHLVDPYKILLATKQKLTTNGVVVASIPNVRYFHNLRKLIFSKQWRYEDKGILDKTHLRFFTQKSIIEMFELSGFKIEIIEGINPIGSWWFSVLIFLTLGFLRDTRFLEFACVARVDRI